MTSRRLYFCMLAGIGVLIIGLLGGVVVANNLLQVESKRLVDVRLRSQALEVQQQQLSRTKADIEKYAGLAAIARGVVPQDKDQAQTVREVVRIAGNNGIKLGSVTFPTSTLGVTGVGGGAGSVSQAKPAVGIPGVYNMQITVQSDPSVAIPYNRFINFLAGLERNRRTALVSAITLQPDTKVPGNVTFTLVIDEYIKP